MDGNTEKTYRLPLLPANIKYCEKNKMFQAHIISFKISTILFYDINIFWINVIKII